MSRAVQNNIHPVSFVDRVESFVCVWSYLYDSLEIREAELCLQVDVFCQYQLWITTAKLGQVVHHSANASKVCLTNETLNSLRHDMAATCLLKMLLNPNRPSIYPVPPRSHKVDQGHNDPM